jgi:hypothetical protein
VQLKLGDFMSQRLISLAGTWATRLDVLKFVANVASGVHSGKPTTPVEQMLDKCRDMGWVRLGCEPPYVMKDFPMVTFITPSGPLSVAAQDDRRRSLDFVHLQLMSTARFLTISPNIERLEAAIRIEGQ